MANKIYYHLIMQPGQNNLNGSSRIRFYNVSLAMDRMGYKNRVKSPDADTYVVYGGWKPEELAKYKNSKGFIWDICDNYFSDHRREAALKLSKSCKFMTTTTPVMKSILEREMNNMGFMKPVHVIEDPVYYNFVEPKFIPEKGLVRCLWYGYDVNLQRANWDQLVFRPMLNNLHKLKNVHFTFINGAGHLPPGIELSGAKYNLVPCSPENQYQYSKDVDFIVLPINPRLPFTRGKSHNKLVDGLACGTMVLASPQNSYLPFSDYAHVTDDIIGSMLHCLDNSEETVERIRLGQEYIKDNFTPDIIAQKWIDLIERL